MALHQVERKSLSDDVFEQLSAEIVDGSLAAGAVLPSERDLCVIFGVNRQAVREAKKRLEQMGLVESRHGSGNRVRNFRRTAGLDALPRLLARRDGRTDPRVLRSVLEMRLVLGADAARLAALRAGSEAADGLDARVGAMRAAAGDVPRLQRLAIEVWELVIDASDNLAYRLAFNSLLGVYEQVLPLWEGLLSPELHDFDGWAAIGRAIRAHDAPAAHAAAHAILAQGHEAALVAIAALEALEPAPATPLPDPKETAR